MNILVIAHYQGDGSPTASFIHDQVKAYRALGHAVMVISPIALGKKGFASHSYTKGGREEIDHIPHYYLRYLSLSNYGKKRFNTNSAISTLKRKFSVALGNFRPDIVHAHTLGFDSEIGKWLKQKLGVPLVVTTHGSDTFLPFANGQLTQLKQYTSNVDTVVCVSALLKKRLTECGTATRMQVILNGFNIQHADCSKKKDPFSIVQVGYLIERKKVDTTIRALNLLQKKYPESSLKVIGSGKELDKLQNLCKELNIEDSVHFLGFRPNPEALSEMATSAFFVMPSVNEGFGIVYLEAMANGCITIGTQGEGISDLIVSGENGFLVPPDDPGAIVQKIEWCLDHPNEATEIAQKGRQDAEELTWVKNAKQYLHLFQTLLERGGQSK